MDASVNYFLNILNTETEHFTRVLDILLKKERTLIDNDHQGFVQVFKQEYELCLKSRELELSRTSLLEVIGRKWGFNPETIKLGEIGTYFGDEYKAKFDEVRKKLRTILKKVSRQNKKCQVLLERSLDILKYTMNLLTKPKKNKQSFYNRSSRIEDPLRNINLIDQKG